MPNSLRTRFLQKLRNRLGGEAMPLRLVFWDGEVFDFAADPRVTITLTTPRLVRLFLLGDIAGLGRAYVKGEIGVEGRVEEVLAIGIRIAERLGASPLLRRVGALLPHRRFRHSRKRDAAAIRYHYDVSNDFYRLWLDRNMIYSCAYFVTGEEDLDRAQEQKLDHICRKLRLKPGERLLDIGCGWGGLLHWAATRYGIEGVGITLSEAQRAYAQTWAETAGLQSRIEIRLQDYREVAGEALYDKIVSVGMYEHVGIANLPLYFAAIGRLLRPGGLVLNHGITSGDRDGRAQGPPGGEFIDQFVFPGGEVPHISHALYEVAGAGLEILDVEDLRPHYPQTLVRWLARLEARREEAIAAAGAERYRIWRMYMAGMAHAFDRGWLSVCQTLAQKPAEGGMAARPWTRRYQYEDEAGAAAPLSRALDWGTR
ncbi:MAG TPA: class I SAM-dependent methyltransferase [Stellaceae bacterium]|nr:class I SAM-dependent methyltransferase [Stellaceae bacterium]